MAKLLGVTTPRWASSLADDAEMGKLLGVTTPR
jgi:hypothetical protein